MVEHSVTLHIQYDIGDYTQVVTLVCSCGERDKLRIADNVPFRERVVLIDKAAKVLVARPGASPTSPQAKE